MRCYPKSSEVLAAQWNSEEDLPEIKQLLEGTRFAYRTENNLLILNRFIESMLEYHMQTLTLEPGDYILRSTPFASEVTLLSKEEFARHYRKIGKENDS